MSEFLSHFNGGQLIAFVAVTGGLLCGLVAILGHFWHEHRLTALKQDMVNRGMSVDEIQAVVDARSDHARDRRSRRGCGA
jgi:hypothetical protein